MSPDPNSGRTTFQGADQSRGPRPCYIADEGFIFAASKFPSAGQQRRLRGSPVRAACDLQMCSALSHAIAGLQQTKLTFAKASKCGEDD